MIRRFVVPELTPDEFVGRLRGEINEHGADRFVTVDLYGGQLEITVRWMGVSRMVYRLESEGGGFRAVLGDEHVARLHAPFVERFEASVAGVLRRAGGSVG